MTRFETIGRIVDHLYYLDDDSLAELLTALSGDISDETLDVITDGKDDTEHLQNSPTNDADLKRAVKELEAYKLLTPQHAP